MAGYRFIVSFVVSCIFASLVSAQTLPAASATQEPSKATTPVDPTAPVTKVYSLSDLGDDQNLCKWIAETIPQMIQPGSWSNTEGKKNLNYYAPGKVVVICHTPAVHAQVEEFIQGLKKAMPPRPLTQGVMPAQYTPDGALKYGPLVSASQAYPIPMQPMAPKHLFHFIIRYEGEGIIDSNVTKFAAVLADAQKGGSSQSYRMPETLPSTLPPSNSIPMPPPTTVGSLQLANPPSFGTVPTAETRKMPPADPPAPTPPNDAPVSRAPFSNLPAVPTLPALPTGR